MPLDGVLQNISLTPPHLDKNAVWVHNCKYKPNDDGSLLGKPTKEDGFKPKKNWDGKKVPNPNGPGYGYPDKKGNVWVPTRGDKSSGNAHGGQHWDKQNPKTGEYENIYPGGKKR